MMLGASGVRSPVASQPLARRRARPRRVDVVRLLKAFGVGLGVMIGAGIVTNLVWPDQLTPTLVAAAITAGSIWAGVHYYRRRPEVPRGDEGIDSSLDG